MRGLRFLSREGWGRVWWRERGDARESESASKGGESNRP